MFTEYKQYQRGGAARLHRVRSRFKLRFSGARKNERRRDLSKPSKTKSDHYLRTRQTKRIDTLMERLGTYKIRSHCLFCAFGLRARRARNTNEVRRRAGMHRHHLALLRRHRGRTSCSRALRPRPAQGALCVPGCRCGLGVSNANHVANEHTRCLRDDFFINDIKRYTAQHPSRT